MAMDLLGLIHVRRPHCFRRLFLLPETYAPELLKRKANKLRKETGNQALYTIYEKKDQHSWHWKLRHNIVRPFELLTTQPIIQVFSMYMAIVYGCMYILLTVFPRVFGDIYGEDPGIARSTTFRWRSDSLWEGSGREDRRLLLSQVDCSLSG